MGLQIDWYNQIIKITSPTTEVDMQVLHDFIEDQLAMPEGLNYPAIITPEGKIEDPVNPGVYSQIIIILQSPWQCQFWGGSGYTRIYGGKLVGGKNDQPIKATGTAGDITVLESPVDGLTVVSGSGITEQDMDDIVDKTWDEILSAAQHNVPNSAGRRLRQLGDVISASVNDGSPTTVSFITSLGQTIDDFYNDQYLRFTSGTLEGIVRIVDTYNGTTKEIHLEEPLPQAPSNGDDFDLIPVHIHPMAELVDTMWEEDKAGHTGSLKDIADDVSGLDALIKQNREGNIKYEYVEATVQNDNRNVAVGKLDRMIVKIKNDTDSDWSSPVDTKTLYMWYAALGDDDPIYVGESD